MYNRSQNKYFAIGLTAFFVICGSLLFTYILFNFANVLSILKSFRKILMPIIDGIALAYLLTPILNLVEKKWLGFVYSNKEIVMTPRKRRLKRSISICITLIITGFVLYIFFSIVIPQIILSVQSIIFQLPVYLNNLSVLITDLLANNKELDSIVNSLFTTYSEALYNYVQNNVLPQINELVKTLYSGVFSFIKGTFNFIVGFIISVYLMSSKELLAGQAKKILYSTHENKSANRILSGIRYTHNTFIGFIGGKIVDSIIIGILTFIIIKIFSIPYPVLISVIVGVTNIIPFFGPYIGAIPSAFLVLMVDPIKALYFIIIVLIIQQVDGNIIGPKILGDSTGLSSFWVIFSITIFGGIFGIAGMIIGVPTFAVIFALIRYKVNRKLKKKNMPTETQPYIYLGSVEKDGSFIEYVPIKGRSILEILGVKKTFRSRANIIEDEADESEPETINEENNG